MKYSRSFDVLKSLLAMLFRRLFRHASLTVRLRLDMVILLSIFNSPSITSLVWV